MTPRVDVHSASVLKFEKRMHSLVETRHKDQIAVATQFTLTNISEKVRVWICCMIDLSYTRMSFSVYQSPADLSPGHI